MGTSCRRRCSSACCTSGCRCRNWPSAAPKWRMRWPQRTRRLSVHRRPGRQPARPLGDSTRQQQAQRCARASAPDHQLVRARKLAAPADGPHQSAAAGQRRQQRGAARLAWLLRYDNRNGLT
jgi:hypothetical protein